MATVVTVVRLREGMGGIRTEDNVAAQGPPCPGIVPRLAPGKGEVATAHAAVAGALEAAGVWTGCVCEKEDAAARRERTSAGRLCAA